MSAAFWDKTIIPIYFFYGLAFYSLGMALLIESGRASELRLARSMRLLAGFGLLHGVHEWIDMLEKELALHYDKALPLWVIWLRLAILATSFIALVAFGEHLLKSDSASPNWRITIAAVVFYMFSTVAVTLVYQFDDRSWALGCDVLSRYILAMPGAVLSCWGLLQQRAIFRKRAMQRFTPGLTVASVALILYGLVGQLFVGKSAVFPSGSINADLFQNTFGFPVQLFRAVMAMTVAFSMMYVLRALEFETRQRLEVAERAKLDAERHSRDDLAALHAELQAAHQETTRLLADVQERDALRGELLQRITTAQENERRRIARELHDGTGQTLTGLALALRGISRLVTDKPDLAAQRLNELGTMATSSLGELRHLINDLRPPQLDDMGLVAALRWQVENINERSALCVEFEVNGTPQPLPPEVETMLFRIVQEGLTNVTKHAQAKQARITLDFSDKLTLTVQDNGVGFEPDGVFQHGKPRRAWGVLGMQERANLINAEMTLESAPNQGTTLTVRMKPPAEQENSYADPRPDR
jgi:signal transduction histidine kinase